MAAYRRRTRQPHPGIQLWCYRFCVDVGPSNWSQGLHSSCGMVPVCTSMTSSQSHDISVWSLQALSHLRCTVIGCVCILIGALAFQRQDIQAFLGIALPGSFTNKPDIVRHTSDSCTCLAEYTNTALCLLLA